MTIIWTRPVLVTLFQRLVFRFGPYESWETSGTPRAPGRGLDDDFDAFCLSFAVTAGAKSADAVKMIIRKATLAPRDAYTCTIIAAAYHVGFIGNIVYQESK